MRPISLFLIVSLFACEQEKSYHSVSKITKEKCIILPFFDGFEAYMVYEEKDSLDYCKTYNRLRMIKRGEKTIYRTNSNIKYVFDYHSPYPYFINDSSYEIRLYRPRTDKGKQIYYTLFFVNDSLLGSKLHLIK